MNPVLRRLRPHGRDARPRLRLRPLQMLMVAFVEDIGVIEKLGNHHQVRPLGLDCAVDMGGGPRDVGVAVRSAVHLHEAERDRVAEAHAPILPLRSP